MLVPFSFQLHRSGGAAPADAVPDPARLKAAICAHLAGLGWPEAEPLRWAITAADPVLGLRLEGVGLCDAAAIRPAGLDSVS